MEGFEREFLYCSWCLDNMIEEQERIFKHGNENLEFLKDEM